MRPNGNEGNSNRNAKSVVFQSLETTNTESSTLLGSQGPDGSSLGRNIATFGGLTTDIVLSMYLLNAQMPITSIGRMNHTGMVAAIMTLVLLISAGVRTVRNNQGTTNLWLGARTVYFTFGLILSAIYLNAMRVSGSGVNGRRQHSLHFQNFIPLLFCIIALGLSWVVRRTNTPTPQYSIIDDDTGDIVFRDRKDERKP